uniref:Ribokinase n=1 Tax=Cajanus cajan TaxID=3821 RepID=A0A151TUN2_CAJCA|nr:Ribokinase [Cajanus cajan]
MQVGCGAVSVDFLATVAAFPNPDDKIRSTSFKVQGGGNAGNALTCASRLGLKPRLISKVADDTQGRDILHELQVDGVDTSFMAVSQDGTSPFTYIIVDSQTKSRTCIHTPGFPPMKPDDLPESSLLTALNGSRLVYFDGRLHETALVVAQESVTKLHAEGIGTVCGRLYIGTAENIPPSELIDTTGAGDAFIGAILYAICANFAREKMLCFAATVAASKCRALGARSGLPYSTDPCLASFMHSLPLN